MKARLAMPYGHRLVSRYAEAREAEAATKVQTLWRSLRAKQKLVKLMAEQKQQEASLEIWWEDVRDVDGMFFDGFFGWKMITIPWIDVGFGSDQ